MTSPRKFQIAFIFFAALGAVGGWLYTRANADPQPGQDPGSGKTARPALPNDCSVRVTREELEKSIALGTSYMVAHQKPFGNFDYEYDWQKKTYSSEDNAARQSGALWGLSLLTAYHGAKASPALRDAVKRGIAYFDERSRTTSKGGRYPIYMGDGDASTDGDKGGIGMAALVTLGIVDYVRTLPAGEERTKLTARANEYLTFLAESVKDDGLWPGDYKYDTGEGVGAHSPYSDGEALLALVTAMKYLGRDDLRPVIEKAAAGGHRVNVDEALAKAKDSATTKGYYQWSSMSFYELATSKASGAAPYGDWLMSLADWIIDVHDVGNKARNTAYAYEGIVSAYAWAKQVKDPRAEKYLCAIHRGLAGLMSWQVGHPRATALGKTDDVKAIGGVQNHATEAPLRIDVVQHQMHATMLTIEHVFATDADK